MVKLYQYVGTNDILEKVVDLSPGKRIYNLQDVENWLSNIGQTDKQLVPATFVIDEEGFLRLADRHSEHIACAGGRPVYCAGEMFFACSEQGIEIIEISNQSTGYCPDIESWHKLQEVLDSIGILHPNQFTLKVIFRRCPACGQRNIVKDEWFFCALCESELPQQWNFDYVEK